MENDRLGYMVDQSQSHNPGQIHTHYPGQTHRHNPGHSPRQTPTYHPEQYIASVHRVEELVIQSPIPPWDSHVYSLPSFHNQLGCPLNQKRFDSDYEGHPYSVFRQDSNCHPDDGLQSRSMSSHQSQQEDELYSKRTNSFDDKHFIGRSLDTMSGSQRDHPVDNRWLGSGSGSTFSDDGRASLYSHVTNPDNHSWEVNSSSQSELFSQRSDSHHLSKHSLVSDKNKPMSHYAKNSSGKNRNHNLPFSTSTLRSTGVYPSPSDDSFVYPHQSSSSSLSDSADVADVDLRVLDKLDDADLYRLSEADDFIHLKPREGLYTRCTPVKENKRFQKESGSTMRSMDDDDPDKEDGKEKDESEEVKDVHEIRGLSKNWNNNNLDDANRIPSRRKNQQTLASNSKDVRRRKLHLGHGVDSVVDSEEKLNGVTKAPTSWRTNKDKKRPSAKKDISDNRSVVKSPVKFHNRSTSPLQLPINPSDIFTDGKLIDAALSNQMQSKVFLTHQEGTTDAFLLQYGLQSNLPLLGLRNSREGPSAKAQLFYPLPKRDTKVSDPTSDTKLSPLRHSYPGSPGTTLKYEDLALSISPKHFRKNVENEVDLSSDQSRVNSRKVRIGSATTTHATHRSASTEYATRVAKSVPNNESRFLPARDQSRNLIQDKIADKMLQKTKNTRHPTKVPQIVKSKGVPKQRNVPMEAASKSHSSTLSLSSSRSPRRTFSILWAFKILDILHSAPPETHEHLVTQLYWFRRWHRNVRLMKAHQAETEEQWDRAVHHHRTNLLWRSLNAWKQAPPSHKRAADQLRQKHLLRKGLRSLRWSAMKSRLEIEGAGKKHVAKTLAHHFSIWKELHQVRTEHAQLLEKLTRHHSVSKTFRTWKDRYSMIQKEGIAKLHFKVSLLNQGFHYWKMFTTNSKVKGYRIEMSRVHREERVLKTAWCTIKMVYAQTQQAKEHYSQKLLSIVVHTWLRGASLAKAERHQHHSQALELRRYGLMRAHFKRWKEELTVVRVKQRLDIVRLRYVWELWTLRMQRKQLYRQIMDSQARKVAKQHHFNRWRLVARRQKDAATKAGLILRHSYLKMIFRAWRNHIIRERDLRDSMTALIHSSHVVSKQKALHTWTSRLRERQAREEAHKAWSMGCVKKAVRCWMERVRFQRMERKLAQFQPVHQMHIERDAWKKWSHEFRLAVRNRKRALSAQQTLLRNRLLRLVLSWRLLVRESKTIAPLLERKTFKQLAGFFDAWRGVVIRRKRCEKLKKLRLENTVDDAFIHWREQTEAKKKVRSVRKALLISKLERTFSGWRDVVQRTANLKGFQQGQRDALVRGVFESWRGTSEGRALDREMEDGDRARETLLMMHYFRVWAENSHQQRETESSLVSRCRDSHSTRTVKQAYESWRRQLLVHNILRDFLDERQVHLLHRVFQAWHTDTRSSYLQLTQRFNQAYEVMGVGFPNDVSSPKLSPSAVNLNLSQSISQSSSSGGSQGLPAVFSTSDSGFYGNELLMRQGGQSSEPEFPQLPARGLRDQSSIHSDKYLGSSIQEAPLHSDRFRELQDVSAGRHGLTDSSDEDVYPEELPVQLRSSRLKGMSQQNKKLQLPHASSRLEAPPQSNIGSLSPVTNKRMSFSKRRASLDQTMLMKTHAEQTPTIFSSVKRPLGMLGPTRRSSVDQGLLSSQTVLNHLRNIHRKSQTENPMLTSMDESQEYQSTEKQKSLSRRHSQFDSPPPLSPDASGYQTPTRSRRIPIPFNMMQPKAFIHPTAQTASQSTSSPLSLTPRTMSPRPSFSPLSKSQSPPSSHFQALSERLSPMEDHPESRRSSISDCSSLPESIQSSELLEHDLCQSATASDYAPSVFSEGAALFAPLIDQRTYLRSIILHWRLWPASIAFNQWLDYTRYRHNLRELADQAHDMFHQTRLRRVLFTWQRRCYVEKAATNHWESKTKVEHLQAWIQYHRKSKQSEKNKAKAKEVSYTKRLSQAYNIWKRKYKKHKAVLCIVHNWKGHVKQTVNLEGRTKDLRQQIGKRSLRICFSMWQKRTWQILEVTAHRNRVVAKRCLMSWASWSTEKAERVQKLHVFRIRRVKHLVLHHWQSQQLKLHTAREFHRRAVASRLLEIMTKWREYIFTKQHREAEVEKMLQEREETLIRETWEDWKRQTRTSQQMKQIFHRNLGARCMRAWRQHTIQQRNLHLAESITKSKNEARIKEVAMRAWYQAYQANQLAQQMQASLKEKRVKEAFQDWRKSVQQCRSDKFRERSLLKRTFQDWKSSFVKQRSSRSSLLKIAQHWRKLTQRSKHLDQSVASYLAQQDRMRQRQAFNSWRSSWQQQRKASAYWSTVILGRCIDAWHKYSATQKERRDKLKLYQEEKRQKMALSMFKKWQKDFLHSRELERRLTGLSQQRAAETLHHVVQSWHHVTMETNAVKQHHSVVQSQAWMQWKKALNNNRRATEMADAKKNQMKMVTFRKLMYWSKARKSQKSSHLSVQAQLCLHSVQTAFILWRSETLKKVKAVTHADHVLQTKVMKEWAVVVRRRLALRRLKETVEKKSAALKLQMATRVWKEHFQRTKQLKQLLEGALLCRDQAILNEAFIHWRKEAAMRRAVKHRNGALLKQGWAMWRMRVREKVLERQFEEDMGEVAEEHYNSWLSKTVLGLWLTEARVGRLRKKHDNRLAKKYAQIWKNGSKMEEIATQLNIYWSMQRTWAIWRRHMIQTLMAKTLQKHTEKQMKEQTFKAWQKQGRHNNNNGLRKDLLNRRLHMAFRVWREKTQSGNKSRSSSISNHSSSAGYTSSSGASELAGIWFNAQRTGAVYGDGSPASQ
ncbi:uncharacterized protein [Asterias amurensis]|uniref:uncharacterized protein n=1 Tax=Asterias amurensis TaxID=7602 RepID=UPI003AB84FF7